MESSGKLKSPQRNFKKLYQIDLYDSQFTVTSQFCQKYFVENVVPAVSA